MNQRRKAGEHSRTCEDGKHSQRGRRKEENQRRRYTVMKTMDAIFMRGKDKQYQMPQKTSKENSKAICLVQEQKLLTTMNMAVWVHQWAERETGGSNIEANPFSR